MEKMGREKYSRSEKSLSQLTKKFVAMLKSEKDIDLNTATQVLEVEKKRRIYDITNVLEGISLIKKTGKNLYSWTGKTCKVDAQQEQYLKELKEDNEKLVEEEAQLTNDIQRIKSNLFALSSYKSFCYLTKKDFERAFGPDRTVIIAKDYKSIEINFDCQLFATSSLLLNNHKETTFRDVHVIGDVVKPTQLKLLNLAPKPSSESDLLFCLDKMEIDEADTTKSSSGAKGKTKHRSRAQSLTLFRRRLKHKKFLELDEEEQEKLATSTLNFDKYKNKSMFHLINDQQLIHPSDYDEPDFIPLVPPADTEYEPNYSSSPPSIHDLFDFSNELLEDNYEDNVEYEMMEYLDEVEVEEM